MGRAAGRLKSIPGRERGIQRHRATEPQILQVRSGHAGQLGFAGGLRGSGRW